MLEYHIGVARHSRPRQSLGVLFEVIPIRHLGEFRLATLSSNSFCCYLQPVRRYCPQCVWRILDKLVKAKAGKQ